MTTSFSSDPHYASLIRDFETLAKVQLGDKLAVSEGKLILTPEGFTQSPVRTVKNLFYGGYNRDAVASYLEDLAKKTEDLMLKYNLASPNFTQVDPSEYQKLTRMVKQAATKVSNIQYEYRSEAPLDKGSAARRLSIVCDRFAAARDSLKGQLKAQPRIFHARTPEDVLKLAENAQKQIVPTWKKVGLVSLAIVTALPVIIPIQFLTLFKWVFWNPIEYLIKGEVTTKNPNDWLISVWATKMTNAFHAAPQYALEKQARKLLSASIITEAYVDAFSKLAHHLKEVDLSSCDLGSSDLEELLEMCSKEKMRGYPEDFFSYGPLAKEALKKYLGGAAAPPGTFSILLQNEYASLKWLDDPHFKAPVDFQSIFKEWKDGFQGDINDPEARQRYFIENLGGDFKKGFRKSSISPKNLLRVIDRVAQVKKCRKIEIPHGSDKIPSVAEALKKGGFKKDDYYDWIYTR